MKKVKDVLKLFTRAARKLGKNQPLVLASSTAFFTMFSIPPILVISVNTLSLYFKKDSVTRAFNHTIAQVFDEKTADQMSDIADNFSNMASKPWITIAGFVFLLFVATNLFKVMRTSINQIWNIRLARSGRLANSLQKRTISLGLILLTCILFFLSTVSDSLITLLGDLVPKNFMGLNTIFILIASKILSVFFITLWFTAVFRFLPDAKISWHAILIGGLVTAILYMIGKYLLDTFLINSNIDNIFETSTSVVLIMLFIFYSSLILYYGASFTFVYTDFINKNVKPRKNAEEFEIKVVPKKN